MEKVENYKSIVESVVEEVYRFLPEEQDGVITQLIKDSQRGHYLVYQVGYRGHHWVYGAVIHIDVATDGKVWVQHDGTNLKIVDELIEKGIPQNQIVLGWQTPEERARMEGFATA